MIKYDHESRFQAVCRHFWQWVLTERQIIVRSKGHIRFVPLSRIIQGGMICVALTGGGWFVYSTVKYFDLRNTVFTQKTVIARSESAYRTLVEEMADSRKRFASLVRLLGQNHGELLDLVEKSDALKSKVEEAKQTRAATADTPKGEAAKTAPADAKPAAPNAKKSTPGKQAGLAPKEQAPQRPAAANARDVQIKKALSSLEGKAAKAEGQSRKVAQGLPGGKKANSWIAGEKAIADDDGVERLDKRVVKLAERLAVVRRSQNKLLNLIATQTDHNIQQAESIIRVTGLDADTLLRRIGSENMAQGGPFIPLKANDLRAESFRSGLSSLNKRMERWQDLQKVLRQMPLAAPMKNYWISGQFGRRRDPFNHRWANHRGTDLAAKWRAQIFASAPGRVRHAGRKGQYGNLIEIDHGMGIRTRYAHLHKIFVKNGQSVDFQQLVGEQGNTGRSQSAHLHYEILVNGKQVNPMNFLQAGEHVFKG